MKSFQTLSSTLPSTNSFWLFSYCEGFLKFLAEQDYAKRTLQVENHRCRSFDVVLGLASENGVKKG